MNRYRFDEEGIAKAVEFLKGKSTDAPAWAKKYKTDLKVKGKKVLYKDLEIIPRSKVDDYLRTEMFKKDGELPFGRDAAHHKLFKSVVGVTRRHLMKFIKAQPIFEHTKAVPAAAKSKGGKRLKTYSVETDLIFIRKNDLVNSNPRFEKSQKKEETYMVSSVEVATGLARLDYVTTKDPKVVTPIVKAHIRSICRDLKVHPRSIQARFDAGGEFAMDKIKELVPDSKVVPVASSVEKKNQDAQRVFYRVLKSRRSVGIPDALKQTQKLLNETFSRIQGMTPNEMVAKNTKTFNIKVYNKARGSYVAGDKRKELTVGTRVRVVKKKDKGGALGFKSYKGLSFSRRVYVIRKITNTKPRKYWVNHHWYTIDKLMATEAEDEATKEMIAARDKEVEKADKKKEEKAEALEKEKAEVMKVVKEQEIKEGVRRRTRGRNPAKEKLKAEREARQQKNEAEIRRLEKRDDEENKRKGISPRRRKRVARSRKYEEEGEKEWRPAARRARKRRVKRV